MSPNTAFLLMAQYGASAIIPVEIVCRDYFRHLTVDKFMRKVSLGQIKMPIVRIEDSQKSARGIHVGDLAAYLDLRHEAAIRDLHNLIG